MNSDLIVIDDEENDVIILSDDESRDVGIVGQVPCSPTTSLKFNFRVAKFIPSTTNPTPNSTPSDTHSTNSKRPIRSGPCSPRQAQEIMKTERQGGRSDQSRSRGDYPGSVKAPVDLTDDGGHVNKNYVSTGWLRSAGHEMTGDPEELIELDDLEDEDAEIRKALPNAPVLRLDDVYVDDRKSLVSRRDPAAGRRKSGMSKSQRIPPIEQPLELCEEFKQGDKVYKPSKTVELKDGDFLRIKYIVKNSRTGDVTLRGNRLQRTRDFNGILEKKLNEVGVFYEIELDDQRGAEEQCVIEVPMNEVCGLRRLRQTNQIFPNCRDIENFENAVDCLAQGNLVLRWKYVVKYASASERQNNTWTERSFEHLRCAESDEKFAKSDAECREEWRGETVPGGAYLLAPNGKLPEGSILVRNDEDCMTEFEYHEEIPSPTPNYSDRTREPAITRTPTSGKAGSSRINAIDLDYPECRKRSYSVTFLQGDSSEHAYKKSRYEDTRSNLSELSLNSPPNKPSLETAIHDFGGVPPRGSIQSTHNPSPNKPTRAPGQKYTFGDAFCGAGGATMGAKMAGLMVKWGFDFCNHACATWSTNFPNATCYQMASHLFVAEASKGADVKVDILHLSPPCQFFSPAHTVNGKDDEMNVASLYAVLEVVKAARPRIITLEQTFGICTPKFLYYFNSLLHQFASLSFSVRWAIIPLTQWGLPQRRYRLIVIASCPGEILPKIPGFTHSQYGESGLKPFVTVNDTLRRVEEYVAEHKSQDPDLDDYNEYEQPKEPYDGNNILPRTMTTHGGQNYHPSGKRDLTLREYAAMQGFPPGHVFQGRYVKKQIGNAVPPSIGKVLFRSIRKQLLEADGFDGFAHPQSEEVE